MDDGKKISVLIASDSDYDRVIAEIYYGEKFVALISQDDGEDNLKVVFPDETAHKPAITRCVELDWLLRALDVARNVLLDKE